MSPRVSVLMPTHNRADVIGYAIASVLRQTEPDFELLVVADGCTDGTVEIVERSGDPRIRIFDLPKAPHFGYANRNVALREARGIYLAFAAHDDLLLPDHLEQMVGVLERTGHEWAYSRPLWVSTDGVIVPSGTNLTNADELEFFFTRGNTIPASCVVYRHSCLAKYGGWPEDVPSAGDWLYWRRILDGGGRRDFAYLPLPTCLHFSADWRKSRSAGVPEIATALEIADASSWWPSALRYEIAAGVPEQAPIAALLAADGLEWTARLRDGVRSVLDRLAWEDLRVVRPRLEASEGEAVALRDRIAALDETVAEAVREAGAARASLTAAGADVQALRQQVNATARRLEAVLASTSWRVTAPLRAVRKLLG